MNDQPNHMPRLPLMKTANDAVALCDGQKDGFYLTAFVLQGWLGQLVSQTTAEYAEKKNAKDRVMQTGQAWRGFREIFRSDQELPQFLGQMLRFTEFDHSLAALLRRALVPLWVEHECSGEYFGPKAMDLAKNPKAGLDLALRSLERWCDWIDALIHFKTHEHWHFAPACFDPDPDKRELASLGTNQRHLTVLSEGAREWWEWHFSEAAERFKNSPEWQMLGKAMISQSDKAWPYREADTLIISLWPLVKKHNWTYRDLLNVIRPAVNRRSSPQAPAHSITPTLPNSALVWAYPCDREQDFATYCTNVLGLRKSAKGISAKNGQPAGYEIARRLCPAFQSI